MLVLDFDGVFTDNKVYLTEDGIESVRCDRGDGMGISLLKKNTDVNIVVISTEKNKVVLTRCKKLGIPCFHGIDHKLGQLNWVLKEYNSSLDKVLFLGNDINDLECIKAARIGAAVADSHYSVIPHADLMLKSNGGNGAVREICDLLLERKTKLYQ